MKRELAQERLKLPGKIETTARQREETPKKDKAYSIFNSQNYQLRGRLKRIDAHQAEIDAFETDPATKHLPVLWPLYGLLDKAQRVIVNGAMSVYTTRADEVVIFDNLATLDRTGGKPVRAVMKLMEPIRFHGMPILNSTWSLFRQLCLDHKLSILTIGVSDGTNYPIEQKDVASSRAYLADRRRQIVTEPATPDHFFDELDEEIKVEDYMPEPAPVIVPETPREAEIRQRFERAMNAQEDRFAAMLKARDDEFIACIENFGTRFSELEDKVDTLVKPAASHISFTMPYQNGVMRK
jgi:hypothetical protein